MVLSHRKYAGVQVCYYEHLQFPRKRESLQHQSTKLQSDTILFQSNIKGRFPNKETTHKTNVLINLCGDSFCAELNCSAELEEYNVSSMNQGFSLTKKKELLEKAQGQSTRDIEKMLIE